MAVAVFFLTSGFIITHVSQRESVAEFTVKRALRIFPVTALFVVISLVLNPHMRVGFTFGDFIRNVTLTNYFIYPQVLTIGVAWTLVIEVVFYVMTAMTMGVRNQWVTVIANLSIPLLAISVCRSYGNDFFLFAVCMSYVPYLVVGQIFYLALYDRSIGILAAIFALVACFGVLMDVIMTMSPATVPDALRNR
jgi:peptidoglycan/LPS O-acetylase OafA/YrhL